MPNHVNSLPVALPPDQYGDSAKQTLLALHQQDLQRAVPQKICLKIEFYRKDFLVKLIEANQAKPHNTVRNPVEYKHHFSNLGVTVIYYENYHAASRDKKIVILEVI